MEKGKGEEERERREKVEKGKGGEGKRWRREKVEKGKGGEGKRWRGEGEERGERRGRRVRIGRVRVTKVKGQKELMIPLIKLTWLREASSMFRVFRRGWITYWRLIFSFRQ